MNGNCNKTNKRAFILSKSTIEIILKIFRLVIEVGHLYNPAQTSPCFFPNAPDPRCHKSKFYRGNWSYSKSNSNQRLKLPRPTQMIWCFSQRSFRLKGNLRRWSWRYNTQKKTRNRRQQEKKSTSNNASLPGALGEPDATTGILRR